ncbi:TPA: hypothetical protein DCZ81_02635, partial [Candidatus Collierbacteria bacterium]|nr:hypothetical protein [Candidatus Collierbacteria bacterium]
NNLRPSRQQSNFTALLQGQALEVSNLQGLALGGLFRHKKPSSLSTRDGELLDPAELDEDGVENVTKEEPHKDNENNYSDDRENKRVGARHG